MQVVEVQGPDGKAYRFAAGSKARFAVDRINARQANPEVVLIEATHPLYESVEFGPDADLASYGDGWTLRTVSHQPGAPKSNKQYQGADPALFYPGGKLPRGRNAELSFEYVSKIIMCFLFMLLLGAILKSFLEQLPILISSYKHVTTTTDAGEL